ncbi:BMP-binding endothelial regulator protein-like [Saccoglossus kowalevskii]
MNQATVVVAVMICITAVRGASVHSVLVRQEGPHCIVKGDPHFETFDGYKYTYMGFCSYKVVAWCGEGVTRPMPLITVTTRETNPKKVGHTQVISLILRRFGTRHFTEVIPDDCSFKLNGREWTTFPYIWPAHGSVHKEGNIFTIESYGQYKVVFDCKIHMVDIILTHPDAIGNLCGMCGNYNGNDTETDELQGYESIDALATAFKAPDPDPGCR